MGRKKYNRQFKVAVPCVYILGCALFDFLFCVFASGNLYKPYNKLKFENMYSFFGLLSIEYTQMIV